MTSLWWQNFQFIMDMVEQIVDSFFFFCVLASQKSTKKGFNKAVFLEVFFCSVIKSYHIWLLLLWLDFFLLFLVINYATNLPESFTCKRWPGMSIAERMENEFLYKYLEQFRFKELLFVNRSERFFRKSFPNKVV